MIILVIKIYCNTDKEFFIVFVTFIMEYLLLFVLLFSFTIANEFPKGSERWLLAKYLITLDNTILEILNSPEFSKGQVLMDYMSSYYETFVDLKNKVQLKQPEVFIEAEYLVQKEALHLVLINYDDIETDTLFGNDEMKIKTFRSIYRRICNLWLKFKVDVISMRL